MGWINVLMNRNELILNAIKCLSGDQFERFAVSLIMRELYSGINPTSASHDGGEDAITNNSVTFLHGGKYISVAASKTSTISKLIHDCQRCSSNGRKRDILVFATSEDIQSDIEEKWKAEIKLEYGWDLELWTPRWMVPVLCRPDYETFVDDILYVPPPDGDFSNTIANEFFKITSFDLSKIRSTISGLKEPIKRSETDVVEGQLYLGKSVILTGDAGTGKSGIGYLLAKRGQEQGKCVLFVDARRFADDKSENGLSNYFHLRGTFTNAVTRIGKHTGCRLIIDQFDSVIGYPGADTLCEIASIIVQSPGVENVIISRKKVEHEINSLKYLLNLGYVEILSHPLNIDTSANLLAELGFPSTQELTRLSTNLLNLELLTQIKQQNPHFDFSKLMDDIDLWEKYVETIRTREPRVINITQGDNLVREAIRLARVGLKSPDREFKIDNPTQVQQRLESWNVIIHVEGYRYRFMHEQLQDFLYTVDAVNRELMPRAVLKEIPYFRTKTILPWMQNMYEKNGSSKNRQFILEVLNG
jgi:hypothetical protein